MPVGQAEPKNETRELVNNLFTKGSHHNKVSIIFTVQCLFRGPAMREISLNASQTVAFVNNRDMTYLQHLGTQLFPPGQKGAAFITSCMEQVKKEPYSFLWIEHSATVETGAFQFRSQVMRGEENKFFIPKRNVKEIDPEKVTESKPLNLAVK